MSSGKISCQAGHWRSEDPCPIQEPFMQDPVFIQGLSPCDWLPLPFEDNRFRKGGVKIRGVASQ